MPCIHFFLLDLVPQNTDPVRHFISKTCKQIIKSVQPTSINDPSLSVPKIEPAVCWTWSISWLVIVFVRFDGNPFLFVQHCMFSNTFVAFPIPLQRVVNFEQKWSTYVVYKFLVPSKPFNICKKSEFYYSRF